MSTLTESAAKARHAMKVKAAAARLALVEDVAWLLDNGVSPDWVHERVGYTSREHLQVRMRRIGAHDLDRRLAAPGHGARAAA